MGDNKKSVERINLSFKVDPELKDAISKYQKKFKDETGGEANEFAQNLLVLLNNQNKDSDTNIQLSKEQITVKKKLKEADDVVTSFLTLASYEKNTAIEESKDKVFKAEQEVYELKEIVKNQKIEIIDLKEKTNEQENIIGGLRESAENIAELKEAWENEKNNMSLRITALDNEAQEARKLKASVISLEKTLSEKEKIITDYKGQLNLADQQNKNNTEIINDLKTQLKENKDIVAEQRENIKGLTIEVRMGNDKLKVSEDNLNSERVQAKENELSLQKTHAKEKEKLIENRTALEKDQFAYIQLQKDYMNLKKELDDLKKK